MFGGNVPPLPQWTGAPHEIIQVQAMLYASLAASLFSAFLAMLGKQWLNRYASTDMRGTGIERSRDRQRKLDGVVTWYFDYVMESLPLMLQIALLLLGCALSRYLLDIDATIARVVIGVTGFGVLFYIFVVVAGTAFASCPYQTPWARILRHTHHTLRRIPNTLRQIHHIVLRGCYIPRHAIPLTLPISSDRLRSWIRSARSVQARQLNQQTTILDSQCISWILQTSLERGIRLSTLKFLSTTPTLAEFTPALVSNCFDVLIDSVKVDEHNPVIVQGMEQLAEASAMCLFLTYSHLSIADPTSNSLINIRLRYREIFPRNLNFSSLPFSHILGTTHGAIHHGVELPIKWQDYKPTNHEHVVVAHGLSKLSWYESQWRPVPPLCLSFTLHYLSQDPLPHPSVIADCLLIIAIDLGRNALQTTILGERCVHVW